MKAFMTGKTACFVTILSAEIKPRPRDPYRTILDVKFRIDKSNSKDHPAGAERAFVQTLPFPGEDPRVPGSPRSEDAFVVGRCMRLMTDPTKTVHGHDFVLHQWDVAE